MKQITKYYLFFFLLLSLCCLSIKDFAQTTKVTGKIVDAVTREPLPFVNIVFKGTIFSLNGSEHAAVEKTFSLKNWEHAGTIAAVELLSNGGQTIADEIKHAK